MSVSFNESGATWGTLKVATEEEDCGNHQEQQLTYEEMRDALKESQKDVQQLEMKLEMEKYRFEGLQHHTDNILSTQGEVMELKRRLVDSIEREVGARAEAVAERRKNVEQEGYLLHLERESLGTREELRALQERFDELRKETEEWRTAKFCAPAAE